MEDKFVAILGGGDWVDASVNLVVVPGDVSILDTEKKKWRDWYHNEYYRLYDTPERPPYISFVDWLIKNAGCREATEDEIYTYEDL